MNKERPPAPDQGQRDLILTELDRNVLVEAAAGTGKTASMVGRMVALLAGGKCEIGCMAAVTFTRKAAAELRGRFQVELERALRSSGGQKKQRLEAALEHIEGSFIGTIHSFCARLLRERPVEAGLDPAFEEIEEDEDSRIRREAWQEYAARLLAHDSRGRLAELERSGIEFSELVDNFCKFADCPDVDCWPLPDRESGLADLGPVISEVREYAAHMERISPTLPVDDDKEYRLFNRFRSIPRIVRNSDLDSPRELMHVLRIFATDKPPSVSRPLRKQLTPEQKEVVKVEQARWKEFAAEYAQPASRGRLESCYRVVMRIYMEARQVYDSLRQARGKLNFQDLLMSAAWLLRENPHVRRYFSRRFTHLLVDEFQDTDPIQAEVMLLLTAGDPGQTDWRKCDPRPGALFIVGDPKQSIYRFRRADIVTYNEVKKIIERGRGTGERGAIVRLSANFRTSGEIIDWVNECFEPLFPESATEQSPEYVPLQAGRLEGASGRMQGVYCLRVPELFAAPGDKAVEYEADFIARYIRQALDEGFTVSRTTGELEQGRPPEVSEHDFMIVCSKKKNLSLYARKLQEYGIAHQVTGGTALNEVKELRLLHTCLRAALRPDNPVSLVATLRSELFGISDRALYSFKRAGGKFDYTHTVTGGLAGPEAAPFRDAFGRLQKYARWLEELPAVHAVEKVISDTGLMVLAAAAGQGGDMEAGSLAKALELLRSAQAAMWSTAQLVESLGRLVEADEPYDGVSALSGDKPVVRIMNLHKVKGLEAPVVFLADPTGESTHGVSVFIDRSQGRVTGHMLIQGGSRYYGRGPKLAQPPQWDELAGREKEFLDAEVLRHRYVAATRAGSMLVITQREEKKNNRWNPWKYFAEDLEKVKDLPDPGPRKAPLVEEEDLGPDVVQEAEKAIQARLACALG
ncbi:MAG: UvrD-helicase domain-containing protein, partial [Gemmatimonadota bacterium]|nr:UvrD-helicase domain-containing protein [Gemmatimonadota bacterium]